VQSDVLEAYPDADLRVYAVFSEFTAGDRGARETVRPDAYLHDPRVRVYWDEAKLAGRWFDENVTKLGARQGVSDRAEWDAYILYGPEARWGETPPSVISWGRTIYSERERLRHDLRRALPGADASGPGS
jgi:hypothetical protein